MRTFTAAVCSLMHRGSKFFDCAKPCRVVICWEAIEQCDYVMLTWSNQFILRCSVTLTLGQFLFALKIK